MKIETEFNVGDEVFYMDKNRVCSGIVSSVFAKVKGDIAKSPDSISIEIDYGLYVGNLASSGPDYREYKLFGSKEELLKSL